MTDPIEPKEKQPVEPDLEQTVLNLLKKHETPNAAVETLLKDNFAFREKNRLLNQSVEELKQNSQTDHTEELAALAQFQTLGTVEEIKQTRSELQTLKRDSLLRQVAEAHEVNFDVLKSLDKLEDNLVISVVEENGKPVATLNELPFNDFVKANWSGFEPSLKQGKIKYPNQHSGPTEPAKGGLVDSFIEMKAARRSKQTKE